MNSLRDSITLTIPAQAYYIDIVRFSLDRIAARMGYSSEDIDDMKVAVSEACNNAVLHAYEADQEGHISVRFEFSHDEISIGVKDEGKSFDFDRVMGNASSYHNKPLEDINAGGLGIYLMQQLMDVVQVMKSESGTEVVLTKIINQNRSTFAHSERTHEPNDSGTHV